MEHRSGHDYVSDAWQRGNSRTCTSARLEEMKSPPDRQGGGHAERARTRTRLEVDGSQRDDRHRCNPADRDRPKSRSEEMKGSEAIITAAIQQNVIALELASEEMPWMR